MTPRTVSILIVAAIVSVAAAAYGVSNRVDFRDTNFEGQRLFPELLETAGNVQEVVVLQTGSTLTFIRDEAPIMREEHNKSKTALEEATRQLVGLHTADRSQAEQINKLRTDSKQTSEELMSSMNLKDLEVKRALGELEEEVKRLRTGT